MNSPRYKVYKNTNTILLKLHNNELTIVDGNYIVTQTKDYYIDHIIYDEYNICCFWNEDQHPLSSILNHKQLELLKFFHTRGYISLIRNHLKSKDIHYIICVPINDIHYYKTKRENDE